MAYPQLYDLNTAAKGSKSRRSSPKLPKEQKLKPPIEKLAKQSAN
jgi:hypothetical protein